MKFFEVLTKKFVKDGVSQLQKFHKFHELFSTRLSQLGWAITSFAQGGFGKCSQVHTKCKEWLLL
jgi:hypothetical protein